MSYLLLLFVVDNIVVLLISPLHNIATSCANEKQYKHLKKRPLLRL